MNKLPLSILFSIISFASTTVFSQQITGPSSSQSPYLKPSADGVRFASIISAGDAVNGYKMAGVPDGLGAFDNGNGTFTLLVNHELSNTLGKVRAHGSKGAFVSKWIINKTTLAVVSGEDLMKRVHLWDTTKSAYTVCTASIPSNLAAFNRFCSANLPDVAAFYNTASGLGTKERIFLNGEEAGVEGRAMAHVVTGPEAGDSYELPWLGKFSWENSVANPATGIKTLVAGMDDATPGQVYFYIGTKKSSGKEIEKAGLTNGKLYGVSVAGLLVETNELNADQSASFTLAEVGDVHNLTGAALQTKSVAAGITQFLRPEDGAWDPSNPQDFYFNTTNSFTGPSRLWRLHFTDLNNPALGGTVTAVLNGTEGQKMLDNLTIDTAGHILLQEDVGNNAHLGKIWQYTIATDELKEIAVHDSTRFLVTGSQYLTQDEESSGILNVSSILGPGMFLTTVQAHYSLPDEVVEGGQLLAFFNPFVLANKLPAVRITNPLATGHYYAGQDINFDVVASDTDGVVTKIEFYNNGGILDIDSLAPYRFIGRKVEAGTYTLTAKATDNRGDSAISQTVKVTVEGCTGAGSISAEGYTNIYGAAVQDLTSNAAFPDKPTVRLSLNEFEYGDDLGNNYGARVRGFICAPATGYYIFYISGDDQAGLWLSTDDKPANKKLIAYYPTWTYKREWYKFATQESAPVHLIKGVRYYIESLHKEYTTSDHLSVAWRIPDGTFEAPIQGTHLSPWSAPLITGGRSSNFSTALRQIADQAVAPEALTVTASPNPFQDVFNLGISTNSSTPVSIILTDLSGRVVERKTGIAAPGNIQLGAQLSKGIYFVEIAQDGKTKRLKIIKQ